MVKEVTNAVQFRDPIQPVIGPDRLLTLLACDDGSIYVFQKYEDSKIWNLRTRGSRDEHPRHWSDRSAPLPGDVEETLDQMVGKNRWIK